MSTDSGGAAQHTDALTNSAQADAWNGDAGRHWVQYRDRREALLRNFTPHLFAAADIAVDARVLDVGCGCGGTTVAAATRAAEGHALGVDLSAPMLAEARRSAAAEGVTNVTFERADVQVHPFAPGGFDAMISRMGVMFFDDPRAAFGNIARALRPGGTAAFLCWQEQAVNTFYTLPRQALSAHLKLAEPGGEPGGPGPFSLAEPAHIRALLTGAGFEAVELTAVTEPMWVGPDIADAAAFQMTTPTNRAAYDAAPDERTRERALSALREALGPHMTPRGVELTGSAWVVSARRS